VFWDLLLWIALFITSANPPALPPPFLSNKFDSKPRFIKDFFPSGISYSTKKVELSARSGAAGECSAGCAPSKGGDLYSFGPDSFEDEEYGLEEEGLDAAIMALGVPQQGPPAHAQQGPPALAQEPPNHAQQKPPTSLGHLSHSVFSSPGRPDSPPFIRVGRRLAPPLRVNEDGIFGFGSAGASGASLGGPSLSFPFFTASAAPLIAMPTAATFMHKGIRYPEVDAMRLRAMEAELAAGAAPAPASDALCAALAAPCAAPCAALAAPCAAIAAHVASPPGAALAAFGAPSSPRGPFAPVAGPPGAAAFGNAPPAPRSAIPAASAASPTALPAASAASLPAAPPAASPPAASPAALPAASPAALPAASSSSSSSSSSSLSGGKRRNLGDIRTALGELLSLAGEKVVSSSTEELRIARDEVMEAFGRALEVSAENDELKNKRRKLAEEQIAERRKAVEAEAEAQIAKVRAEAQAAIALFEKEKRDEVDDF
jgi:hypothetical protein